MPVMAQTARDFIRMGNKAYRAQQYEQAETYYLKSIAKSPSFEAYYNLGNAYVMQEKDSTAFENYKKADSLGTTDPMRKPAISTIWETSGMHRVWVPCASRQAMPLQHFSVRLISIKVLFAAILTITKLATIWLWLNSC